MTLLAQMQMMLRRFLAAFADASAPGRAVTPARLLYALLALRLATQLYRLLTRTTVSHDAASWDTSFEL